MRLVSSLGLLACVLLISSCNRRPPVAVTPTSISTLTLQSAHREFAMGDYANAVRDYERYLQLVTSGEDRDQALYHLGVIYAMPDSGRQDWPKAIASLKGLLAEFPQSSLNPAAQLILSLRDRSTQLTAEIEKLTTEAGQLKNESSQLRNQIAQLRTEEAQLRGEATQLKISASQLNEQLMKLKADADLLMMELDQKNQRIRQLNTELDRLNRLDATRPSRPQGQKD